MQIGEVVSIHPESYIFCVDQKFNHDIVFIKHENYLKIVAWLMGVLK
jgi:hypothetical protein